MSDYKVEDYIGGFPNNLFNNKVIIDHIENGSAANGGGYIGRWQDRTDARDKDIYQKLTNLNLGEDFVVMFLTSRLGRWYAESISSQGDEYYGNPNKFRLLLGILVEEGVIKCDYKNNNNIKI